MSAGPSGVEGRLAALGLALPPATAPRFQYVPVVEHAGVAYVSGQVPRDAAGVLMVGKLGAGLDLEAGRTAARMCVLQALSQLRAHLGDLARVERILKVTGFVASAAGFCDQPKVMDAASELLGAVFGDGGRHARSAVGVAELPGGCPVEVEMVIAVRC